MHKTRTWVLAVLLVAASPVPAGELTRELTFDEAVTLALQRDDPSQARFEARARMFEHRAVAEAQLPDPLLTGQVANLPVDSFDFGQEGMTQAMRIGLRQEFPAGRTLALTGRQRSAQAEAERARAARARRDIALEVRNAWLDLVWHRRAVDILEHARGVLGEQIGSLSARFATGRMHAQDVLRAELELDLIDDRMTEHRRQIDVARAALARYLGPAADRPVPGALPALAAPAPIDDLQRRLLDHPAVAAVQDRIDAAELGVAIEEQGYQPKFALEAGYGLRTEWPDLASIGVTLSLPLFVDKRQDRRRAAAVQQVGAARLDRDLLLRELRRRLLADHASYRRLDERVALYAGVLRERARQTAEAAITTYANNQTDFSELIRSQLAELDAELKQAELETRRARAWARLAWLTGDPS